VYITRGASLASPSFPHFQSPSQKKRSNPVTVPTMHPSAGSRSSSPNSEGGRDSIENTVEWGGNSPRASTISAAQSSRLDPTASTGYAIEICETPEPPGSETPTNVDLPPFARGLAQFSPMERPRTRNPQLSNLLSQSSSRQKTPPWELPPILSPLPTMPRPLEREDASQAGDMGGEGTISVANSGAHLGHRDGEGFGFTPTQLSYLERRLGSDLRDEETSTQVLYAADGDDQTSVGSAVYEGSGADPMLELSDTTHSVHTLTSAGMTDALHVRSPELPVAPTSPGLPSSPPPVPDAQDLRVGFNRDGATQRARAQLQELVQKIDTGVARDLLEASESDDELGPSSPSERASAKRVRSPGSPCPPGRRGAKAPRQTRVL
jgi:hypothetical protein